MTATQYIGARYVPKFAEPIQWDSTNTYEPLTIVLSDGNSYTSTQAVPAGVDINNENFWAETGNYNAQIEKYRAEVNYVTNSLNYVTPEQYGAKGDGVSDDSDALQNAIDASVVNGKMVLLACKSYRITKTINVTESNVRIVGTIPLGCIGGGFNQRIGSVILTSVVNSFAFKCYSNDSGTESEKRRTSLFFENITFMGQTSNEHGLYVGYYNNLLVENCNFINLNNAVEFNKVWDSTFNNNYVMYNKGVGLTIGAETDSSNGLHFSDNRFESCGKLLLIDRAIECVFTNCKFEQGGIFNKESLIKLTEYASTILFTGCVMVFFQNDFYFMDIRSHSNIINGCSFLSNEETNAKFCDVYSNSNVISNCTFTSLYASDSAIITLNGQNNILSNSTFYMASECIEPIVYLNGNKNTVDNISVFDNSYRASEGKAAFVIKVVSGNNHTINSNGLDTVKPSIGIYVDGEKVVTAQLNQTFGADTTPFTVVYQWQSGSNLTFDNEYKSLNVTVISDKAITINGTSYEAGIILLKRASLSSSWIINHA